MKENSKGGDEERERERKKKEELTDRRREDFELRFNAILIVQSSINTALK